MSVILLLKYLANQSISSPITPIISLTTANTADPNDRRSTRKNNKKEGIVHLSKNHILS